MLIRDDFREPNSIAAFVRLSSEKQNRASQEIDLRRFTSWHKLLHHLRLNVRSFSTGLCTFQCWQIKHLGRLKLEFEEQGLNSKDLVTWFIQGTDGCDVHDRQVHIKYKNKITDYFIHSIQKVKDIQFHQSAAQDYLDSSSDDSDEDRN